MHVREFAYVPACEHVCHRMRVYIYLRVYMRVRVSAWLRACECVRMCKRTGQFLNSTCIEPTRAARVLDIVLSSQRIRRQRRNTRTIGQQRSQPTAS